MSSKQQRQSSRSPMAIKDNVSNRDHTPGGRQSNPVFARAHSLESGSDYEEKGGEFYANQSIPYVKKVLGGEAAYDHARMKKGM